MVMGMMVSASRQGVLGSQGLTRQKAVLETETMGLMLSAFWSSGCQKVLMQDLTHACQGHK